VHGDWDVAGDVRRLGSRGMVTWHVVGVVVGGARRLGRGGVVMWHVRGIAVGGARRLGRGGWCPAIGTSRGGDVAHRWRRRRCWLAVSGDSGCGRASLEWDRRGWWLGQRNAEANVGWGLLTFVSRPVWEGVGGRRRIKVYFTGPHRVYLDSARLCQTQARVLQESGKSLARVWQESGKSLARVWQESSKTLARL